MAYNIIISERGRLGINLVKAHLQKLFHNSALTVIRTTCRYTLIEEERAQFQSIVCITLCGSVCD